MTSTDNPGMGEPRMGASADAETGSRADASSPRAVSTEGFDPARRFDLESISVWPERRPPRAEAERSAIADRFASHLPNPLHPRVIGEEDILAMRAAFIRRFDEQLPRTETLMAVARIGYRMALRDLAPGTPSSTREETSHDQR